MSDGIDPHAEAPQPPPELDAKRLLKDQAEDLLDEKGMFMIAVRATRIRWYRELLAARGNRELEDTLLSQLRVLDDVPRELERYISDYKVGVHNLRHRRA